MVGRRGAEIDLREALDVDAKTAILGVFGLSLLTVVGLGLDLFLTGDLSELPAIVQLWYLVGLLMLPTIYRRYRATFGAVVGDWLAVVGVRDGWASTHPFVLLVRSVALAGVAVGAFGFVAFLSFGRSITTNPPSLVDLASNGTIFGLEEGPFVAAFFVGGGLFVVAWVLDGLAVFHRDVE